MSNPFQVGHTVMHNVELWEQPTSNLTITHIRNLVVVAVDDSGKKFIGNYGCFDLVKRGINDINLTR